MKEPKREREMMGYGEQEFTLRGKEESFGVNHGLMVWCGGKALCLQLMSYYYSPLTMKFCNPNTRQRS